MLPQLLPQQRCDHWPTAYVAAQVSSHKLWPKVIQPKRSPTPPF